jgi:hypothetical protein
MKRFIAVLVLALAALTNAGCTNGAFDPKTASGVVNGVSAPACGMLGVVTGNQTVGAVCEDVAGIVSAILSQLKLSASAPSGPVAYAKVTMGDRVIGFVRADLAAAVQAELDKRAVAK